MIIKYKYGFFFKNVIYGFKDKKVFRLPQMIGKRFYPLLEIKLRKVGNKEGYLLYGNRYKSLKQIESMAVVIDKEVQLIKDSDCPF
jgi:hypothetical protein